MTRPDQHKENKPPASQSAWQTLAGAVALDDGAYLAFHRELARARPIDVLEWMFAVAPGCGHLQVTADDLAATRLADRKRLLVRVWASLPDAERRAFLARLDTSGAFRGGPQ